MNKRGMQLTVLAITIGVAAFVVLRRQAILDYWSLRGYSAPAAVVQLGTEDTMTPTATHLFYVNRPVVSSGDVFTKHCPSGGEKTVVLGCYVGSDDGIYIYQVDDVRLNGVQQVTAAHEMLHAAYRRLPSSEKKRVDAMLQSYYEHGLTDARVKETIESYKQSEPNDVVNEMHSVFGTEVPNLPSGLEAYYKQYFRNRSVVTSYTAQYQAVFTDRQNKVATYDTQLKELKQQIATNQTELERQKNKLSADGDALQSLRDSGQVSAYNSGVSNYNQEVATYNALLEATKGQINQYNQIVDARNAVALEEQQLAKELSANSLPDN